MSLTRKLTSPLTRPVAIASGATAESDSVVLSGGYKSFTPTFVGNKSIKFDGTDDVITTSADSTLASKTYSFWAKTSDTSRNAVWGHGADYGSSGGGAFFFNWNTGSNKGPILWIGGGRYILWQDDTCPEQDDGLWHHWLVYLDTTTVSDCRLFCDGVEKTTVNATAGGSGGTYASGIQLGFTVGSDYFSGSLDEFAIFDGDQSALADALYNNGQPTNLSSYSTLAAWYRMGEGKDGTNVDGTQNLLFQGLPTTRGSELITNTDFSSASGWNLDSNASISGGKLVLASSSGISYVTLDLDDGDAYEVTFTIENLSSGSAKPYLNGTNGTVRNANGTYTEIVIAGSSNTIVGINPSGSMHIDNFSVKKLTNVGTINGAEIQADGGSELIVNGTFDSNVTSWPASSGGTVTWSNGTAITGAVGTDDRGGMSQTFTTVNGRKYTLSFSVISRTSTKWEVYRQGTGPGTIIEGTALGSHKITFTAASNSTELAFYAKQAGTSDGTVAWDNISVKEVTESVPKQVQNLPSGASKKSMDFDGTDDFVDTGFQPDFIHTNATMSYWVKMGDLSGAQLCGTHNAKRFYLGLYNATAGMGVQNQNNLGSGADLSSFLKVNTWHHIAMVAEGGTATFYLDGIARDTLSYTQNSANNPSENLYIGGISNGGSQDFMNASIDEFAIWNTALDGDAVKALYNAGLPTTVTTKTGAYDIYRDNLKAYYRMGDASDPAADGTSNLLFDQTSPGVGSELLTNGDFSDASVPDTWNGSAGENLAGWAAYGPGHTANAHVTITNGAARIQSDGTYVAIRQDVLSSGVGYKYSVDVTDVTSGSIQLFGGAVLLATINSTGTFSGYFKTTDSNPFYVKRASTPTDVTFDNVSVKEVNGSTGTITSATIQTEAPKAIYALPPVDNTKSLNFDGTNDHLVTQVDSTAQPNNESRYYSWWSKATRTTHNPVFDHGNAQKGAFHFNHSSGRPLLWMANTVYKYWNDNTAQDSGAWAHWVLRISTNAINDCQLWCNGVELTNASTVNTGSMNTYDTGIRIGRGGGTYFEGSLDEFSIHEDLDEEAIRALFNRGRPIDISSSNGAYDLSDKALHWWRMGDATSPAADGTNDIIFQGFEAEGSELVTNGDLSTWTDTDTIATWTHKDSNNNGGGGVISQVGSGEGSGGTGLGSANYFTASGTNMSLTSGTISEAGRTYRLEIEVSRYVQGIIRVQGAVAQDFGASDIVDGKIVKIFTATSATYIRVQGSNACDFTVDNVSLKQVRGQYIGAEEITNGDFSSSSNWTLTGSAEITGGVANWPDATNSTIYQNANINLAGIHAYRLEYDVVTTNGSSGLRLDGGSSAFATTSIPSDTVGKKTVYVVSNGSQAYLMFNNSASFVGSIDNVSLKPVGGAAVMTNMTTSDIQTDTPY